FLRCIRLFPYTTLFRSPLIYNQLDASTKGMAEACDTLGTPVVSGNVSLYNETKEASILPTPVIGMVGLIEDVNKIKEDKVSEGEDRKSTRLNSSHVSIS